jgi:hypothetical protein
MCELSIGGRHGGPSAKRAYLPRLTDASLDGQLRAMGAVLVEGVKGCGKTATARQVATSEVPSARIRTRPDALSSTLVSYSMALLRGCSTSGNGRRACRTPFGGRSTTVACPGSSSSLARPLPMIKKLRHSGAGRFGLIRMRTMTLTEKQATTAYTSVSGLLKGTAPDPGRGAK